MVQIVSAILLFLGLVYAPAATGSETRVALVIGNGRYDSAPQLPNPSRDANALAATLREVQFTRVTVATDLTREKLLETLRAFAAEAERADWAVIYYAGHGIEVAGTNYLVPTNARLLTDRDVQFEAVALQQVLAAVEGARKLRLVILDACRDNPFLTQMKRSAAGRSLGRGLARIEPEGGVLVAYAAKEGQVALDGDGENSPFVSSMVKHIATPGLEINRVFRRVRGDVLSATQNRQEPFVYGSLPDEEFYFRSAAGGGAGEGLEPRQRPAAVPREVAATARAPDASARLDAVPDGPERLAALRAPPNVPSGPGLGSTGPALLELQVEEGGAVNWGGRYAISVVDKLGGSVGAHKCELTFGPDRTAGKDYLVGESRCDNIVVDIPKGSGEGPMPFAVSIDRLGGQRTVLKSSLWNLGQAQVKAEVIYPTGGGPMRLGGTVTARVLPPKGVSLDGPEDQICRWQVDQMTGQGLQLISKNGCEAKLSIKPRSIILSLVQQHGYKVQTVFVHVLDQKGMRLGSTEVKYSVVP